MPVSSPHPCNFHGFDKDGIAVDFNHHHDVGVALLRTCRELARLVGEHGFVYLVCFGVYITYFLTMELRGVACFEWDRFFFGGVYVLPSLYRLPWGSTCGCCSLLASANLHSFPLLWL